MLQSLENLIIFFWTYKIFLYRVSVSSGKGESLTTIPDILIVGGRGPNPTSEVEVLTFKGESQKTSDKSNFPNYPVEITGEGVS
jgi:hypothetical protein